LQRLTDIYISNLYSILISNLEIDYKEEEEEKEKEIVEKEKI